MKWSELPQEYKDLANNFPEEADFGRYGKIERLSGLFIWSMTTQGHRFWSNCEGAKSISELPKIPE